MLSNDEGMNYTLKQAPKESASMSAAANGFPGFWGMTSILRLSRRAGFRLRWLCVPEIPAAGFAGTNFAQMLEAVDSGGLGAFCGHPRLEHGKLNGRGGRSG